MPCYQTQSCNVTLENAEHDLLEQALAEEGYTVARNARLKMLTFTSKANPQISGTYANNTLSVRSPRGTTVDTDAIKRAYSKQALKAKAKKNGWKIEAKPGNRFIIKKAASRM
jgi:Tfp pilus assembly protein PilE